MQPEVTDVLRESTVGPFPELLCFGPHSDIPCHCNPSYPYVDPSSAISPSGIHTKTLCIFGLSSILATIPAFRISVGYRFRYNRDVTITWLNCSSLPSNLGNPWQFNQCDHCDILHLAFFSHGVCKWGQCYCTQRRVLKFCFRKSGISLV